MDRIDLTQTHDVFGAYQSQSYSDIKKKYTDPGTQYAFDVLDKKILTSYPTQLAAFRHLQDLKRSELHIEGFDFHYDMDKCQALLNFASVCPEVTDKSKPVRLMDWQKYIMCMLQGWRQNADDQKRFTNADISMGRAQGKTEIMGIYTCYNFLFEIRGKSNKDLLITAPTFEQSKKLLRYIKTNFSTLKKQKRFSKLMDEIGLQPMDKSVIAKEMSNVIHMLSYGGGKYDSDHYTLAVFDEMGDIPDLENVGSITTGQSQEFNHQFIKISTAYKVPNVPFHREEKQMIEAMERDYKRESEQTLCLIWQQDDLSETYKPETWCKSNPLLNLPDQKDSLLKGLLNDRESKMLAGSLFDFQNKNLNMWLQTKTNSFLKLDEVGSAVIDDFNIEAKQVYIGFDDSMFSDNTSIAFVYPYIDENGRKKFHIEQHSFIPWHNAGSIDAKEKQDGINYREQEQQGFCTITSHPDGLINPDQVYEWLLNYVEDHHLEVIMFGYDFFNMSEFVKRLDLNTSWKLMPIRQRTSELKDPTKFLQKVFIERSVTRLNDPVMEKALLNAEIKEDSLGIQVDKSKATYKIDVVDALIDAFYQAMYHFEDFSLANDKSTEVERMTPDQVAEEISMRLNVWKGGEKN